MYLQELQRNWETFGKEDPLWAVASRPEKADNNWDVQEFFDTGTKHIGRILKWMEANGYPHEHRTALDFGCGVGRLTQALCEHFQTCVGIDIAPSMLAKAREFNRYGHRCVYRLNEAEDLSLFREQTFDMVQTAHVLQHIRPPQSLRYIQEFIRVLKPGGLAVFHCPSQKAVFAYPEGGVSCSLTCDDGPRTMEQGTKIAVEVRVTNTGTHPIGMNKQVNAPVRLRHHWYNLDTDELFERHGRANLPHDTLEPGASLTLDYKAASPPEPGRYMLVITAVDHRSIEMANPDEAQCVAPVLVVARSQEDGTGEGLAKERPCSETHVIPVETVRKAVEAAGGKMLDVQSTQCLPGGQISSLYYATR